MGMNKRKRNNRRSAPRARRWRLPALNWRRIGLSLQGPLHRRARRDRPLAPGLSLLDGEVHNRIVVPDHQKHWTKVALDRMLSIK